MHAKDNLQNDLQTLTAPDVAGILQVSPKTLEVWRRTGSHELPFYRLGRAIRYDPKDVQSYLEKMRCSSNN